MSDAGFKGELKSSAGRGVATANYKEGGLMPNPTPPASDPTVMPTSTGAGAVP